MVRPKARGRTPKSICPPKDSVLGKWVIWKNFSSEPSALPVTGPPVQPQSILRTVPKQQILPSQIQHLGQLPATLRAPLPERQDARNERLTPLHTLLSTEAPLPCPSHTRSHPPEAPGTPPFSLCPKKEKKPRHKTSLSEPRERTPPTSSQP